MNDHDFKHQYRRKLPHLQDENCILFVTFRVKFTMPATVINDYHQFKNNLLSNLEPGTNNFYRASAKIFDYYDSLMNEVNVKYNYLQEDLAAKIVEEQIHRFNNVYYDLKCLTIMPNHVHMLIQPLLSNSELPYPIGYIMMRIKGATSRFINLALKRDGDFWQREYYDHKVKSDEEYFKIVHYIVNNPVKAGLVNDIKEWKGTWVADEVKGIIE